MLQCIYCQESHPISSQVTLFPQCLSCRENSGKVELPGTDGEGHYTWCCRTNSSVTMIEQNSLWKCYGKICRTILEL